MATHPFVLLVESDPMLRELIQSELKDHGCVVFDAAGSDEAIAFAKLYPGSIDLAVTDLPNTHQQDQTFTHSLRSLPTGTDARIIHMTTRTDTAADAATDLRQSYLPKPFDRRTLLDTILSALPTAGGVEAQPDDGDRAVFWGAVQTDQRQEVGVAAR